MVGAAFGHDVSDVQLALQNLLDLVNLLLVVLFFGIFQGDVLDCHRFSQDGLSTALFWVKFIAFEDAAKLAFSQEGFAVSGIGVE